MSCNPFVCQKPSFKVTVPETTEFPFVNNADPAKGNVVRKKAREWVNRQEDLRRTHAGHRHNKVGMCPCHFLSL